MDSRLVGNLGHQPVSYAGNGKHGGSVRLEMPPLHQGKITFQIIHGCDDILHRFRKREAAYGFLPGGIGLFIRRFVLERHAYGNGFPPDSPGDIQRAGVNQESLVLLQGNSNVQRVQPDSVRLRQIHGNGQAGNRSDALKGYLLLAGAVRFFRGGLFLLLGFGGHARHAACNAGQPDQGSQSHGR